jgi:hypothetical protein
LNDPEIREAVVGAAAEEYGYDISQVRLRLYVGKFAAGPLRKDEDLIRAWAKGVRAGGGPIEVYGVSEVAQKVRAAAARKTYRDNPVLVTLKVLDAAGLLAATDTSGVQGVDDPLPPPD